MTSHENKDPKHLMDYATIFEDLHSIESKVQMPHVDHSIIDIYIRRSLRDTMIDTRKTRLLSNVSYQHTK